jgi:transcriptional regulator with XRE-family HTH domain
MNFQDVLNKATHGHSDGKTAKKLGVTRQAFSHWRNGRRTPEDEILDQIAELSGLPVEKVYLAAYADKLENAVAAAAFRHLAA